jgi:hypothetical protein
LVAAVDERALPLFARMAPTAEMVAKKGRWVATGRYEKQEVILAEAAGSKPSITVTLPGPDEQQIDRLPAWGVDWNGIRAAMLSLPTEEYARRAAERTAVDLQAAAEELRAIGKALARRRSLPLDELQAWGARRRKSHALLWACARDTAAAAQAVERYLGVVSDLGLDPEGDTVFAWITSVGAAPLVANLDDPALAGRFNALLRKRCAHVCAGVAFDLVERLGREAAPILVSWQPGLSRYRDEKAIVAAALQLVA